ncbi:hypothetical protein EVAR_35320_1 [Eumeta japonica]|uniref:Uncharacterized protein n=1 Tax=Eumeta variegata TaxID=151549 RepID=A0A4C1XJZ0_EUMVA|nr:hypothetical protein EVAR_35320_1 [Eumeta japonica]
MAKRTSSEALERDDFEITTLSVFGAGGRMDPEALLGRRRPGRASVTGADARCGRGLQSPRSEAAHISKYAETEPSYYTSYSSLARERHLELASSCIMNYRSPYATKAKIVKNSTNFQRHAEFPNYME